MVVNLENVGIVPFHWGHPDVMDLREFDRAYFSEVPDFRLRLKMYSQQKHSYSAIVDGQIACCWGAYPLWSGVAEAWLITSYKVETYPVALTRGAMRYFNNICTDMALHRLQLSVDCRNVVAVRWARALSFKEEGVMKKYGPTGADHIMFART